MGGRGGGDVGSRSGVGAYSNFKQPELCGQMEGGIAIVFEVWALEVLRVVLYDAFEKNEVAEMDCAANSDGYIDRHVFLTSDILREYYEGKAC